MADLPANLGQVAGPPFLGIIINNYLFGILTLQYYNYHVNFRNDYPILRAIVHTQFILETAQTIMSIADGFHWFVYGFGNPSRLQEYFLANIDSPIICSVIALVSQSAYCWRIYHLSHWKTMTLVIAMAACGQAAGGFAVGIVNQRAGTILGWNRQSNIFLAIWTGCSAITDTLIAIVMTYLLLSSNTLGTQRRSTVATRIVRLIVETNVASATVAIIVLLTAIIRPIAPPRTSLFLCPGYVLGKLYSNSFITMLNSRQFAGGLVETLGVETENIAMERQGINLREPRHVLPSPGVEGIAIHTETSVRFDSISDTSRHNLKSLSFAQGAYLP